MSKAKPIVVAVAGVAVVAAVCVGLGRYRDYRRDCADKRVCECLREYDRIVGDGRKEVSADKLRPVLVEMLALSGSCSDMYLETLFDHRLDGAFLIGDYALAEKMMDDMPGKSANWKEGAKAKIRAHAALERGDKSAAIREFQAFCQTLLTGDPDSVECDPCSGIEWSHEGLLARNFKRMSELAAEIGDKDRASKFLEDARKYAKVALQKAEGDEAAKKAMLDDFGELAK